MSRYWVFSILLLFVVGTLVSASSLNPSSTGDVAALVETEAEGVGEWFEEQTDKVKATSKHAIKKVKEKAEIIVSYVDDIVMKISKKVLNKIDELVGKCNDLNDLQSSCQDIFGFNNPHAPLIEQKSLDQGRSSGELKDVGTMDSVVFWTEAARAATLSRYAYKEVNEVKRDDVQVLHFWNSVWDTGFSGANAFMSVRKHNHIPKRSRFHLSETEVVGSKAQRERMARWNQYADELKIQWKQGETAAVVEIVVRGTASKLDFIIDAMAMQVPCVFEMQDAEGNDAPIVAGKVHTGFYKQSNALYDNVEEALKPFLADIRAGKTKLVFTGHSMGGAVAQILALRYALQYLRVPNSDQMYVKPQVFTFGCPRAGNPIFATYIEKHVDHFRFKFMGDVVSEVPMNILGDYSYRHGDKLALGIGMKTGVAQRATWKDLRSNPASKYFVYCLKECSKTTSVIRQILTYHAMDFSYERALASIWLWQRDDKDPHSVFNAKEMAYSQGANSVSIGLISEQIGNEKNGYDGLISMQCMGNIDCERAVAFPGTNKDQRLACEAQLDRKGIGFDPKTFARLTAYEPLRASKFLYEYQSAYYDCMKPMAVSGDFYKGLKAIDWMKCQGNVYCIMHRLVVIRRCHGNKDCEREITFPGLSDSDIDKCKAEHGVDTLKQNGYIGNLDMVPWSVSDDQYEWVKYPKLSDTNRDIPPMESYSDFNVALYKCLLRHSKGRAIHIYDQLSEEEWEDCEGSIRCLQRKARAHRMKFASNKK